MLACLDFFDNVREHALRTRDIPHEAINDMQRIAQEPQEYTQRTPHDDQCAGLNDTFMQNTAALDNIIICATATVVKQHSLFVCHLRCRHITSLCCTRRLHLCLWQKLA